MKKIFFSILIFLGILINISFGYTLTVNDFKMEVGAGRKVTVKANLEPTFINWVSSDITLTDEEYTNPVIQFTMPKNDVTLVANYGQIKKTYTVTFNANDGTESITSQTFQDGVAQNLTTNTFIRDGYKFIGWSTSSSGSVEYVDGASYTATANITLYAIWEQAVTWKKYVASYQDPVTTYYWNKYNKLSEVSYSVSEGSQISFDTDWTVLLKSTATDSSTRYHYSTSSFNVFDTEDYGWVLKPSGTSSSVFYNEMDITGDSSYACIVSSVSKNTSTQTITFNVYASSSSMVANGGSYALLEKGAQYYVIRPNRGYYYKVYGVKSTTNSQGSTSYGTVSSTSSSAYPQNGASGSYWYVYSSQSTADGYYYQGDYIEDVTSSVEDTYPENGYHTDGYWYVKVN